MEHLICRACANEDESRIMGMEWRGVYDGVLVWQCLKCRAVWGRNFGEGDSRNDLARRYAVEVAIEQSGLSE